jgi:hypothetical protein
LKINALKLDFIVPLLLYQKLIKKKEDKPIDSQPKNKVNKLLAKTSVNILKINHCIRRVKISSFDSYLK